MTTSELIEELKKADPSGKLHVRMAGGVPKYVYPLSGYWDGNYRYIQDGKMHYSTRGNKVDIVCWSEDEIMEEIFMDHDFSETTKEDAWKVALTYFSIDWNKEMNPENDHRSQGIFKRIERSFEFEWSYVEEKRVGN